MTNKEIFAKVHTILQLAMEISTITVADVFAKYYPHVAEVRVRIYKHGWKFDTNYDVGYDCYLKHPNGWFIREGWEFPSLDEVIAELEELKEQAEKLPESEVTPDEHS